MDKEKRYSHSCGSAHPGTCQSKPSWLKTRIPRGADLFALRHSLREKNLHTVCEEANCPNMAECWQERTATFMLLGGVCTRGCRFCNVASGTPGGLLDANEPRHTAESVRDLALRYVVLTMVTRDDLEDGGAAHLRDVMLAIPAFAPATNIELLGSDFQGNQSSLLKILEAEPVVFAHNIETVEALTSEVRDTRADYRRSLSVLRHIKALASYPLLTKSALMLGLGECETDILQAFRDLREVGVDFLTIGQYLQPSAQHIAVADFVPPDRFEELGSLARSMGFRAVASAPLVRSSYKAQAFYDEAIRSIGDNEDKSDS